MHTHSTVKKTWGQNSQNFVQLSTLSPTFSSMSAINYLKTGNFVFCKHFFAPGTGSAEQYFSLCIAPSIDLFSLFSLWRSQGNLPQEPFRKLCVHMFVKMNKFETNSFLQYHHMTCIGKTKQWLRSSVSLLVPPCNCIPL